MKTPQFPVAETILQQMGGRHFIQMTGTTNFAADENSLRFDLPKEDEDNFEEVLKKVIITLDNNDTYKMEFVEIDIMNFDVDNPCKTISEFSGVYFDQLQDIFTEQTGMFTKLF